MTCHVVSRRRDMSCHGPLTGLVVLVVVGQIEELAGPLTGLVVLVVVGQIEELGESSASERTARA